MHLGAEQNFYRRQKYKKSLMLNLVIRILNKTGHDLNHAAILTDFLRAAAPSRIGMNQDVVL